MDDDIHTLRHLKNLGRRIANLDSGSKDAEAIFWAISKMERLRKFSDELHDLRRSAFPCKT